MSNTLKRRLSVAQTKSSSFVKATKKASLSFAQKVGSAFSSTTSVSESGFVDQDGRPGDAEGEQQYGGSEAGSWYGNDGAESVRSVQSSGKASSRRSLGGFKAKVLSLTKAVGLSSKGKGSRARKYSSDVDYWALFNSEGGLREEAAEADVDNDNGIGSPRYGLRYCNDPLGLDEDDNILEPVVIRKAPSRLDLAKPDLDTSDKGYFTASSYLDVDTAEQRDSIATLQGQNSQGPTPRGSEAGRHFNASAQSLDTDASTADAAKRRDSNIYDSRNSLATARPSTALPEDLTPTSNRRQSGIDVNTLISKVTSTLPNFPGFDPPADSNDEASSPSNRSSVSGIHPLKKTQGSSQPNLFEVEYLMQSAKQARKVKSMPHTKTEAGVHYESQVSHLNSSSGWGSWVWGSSKLGSGPSRVERQLSSDAVMRLEERTTRPRSGSFSGLLRKGGKLTRFLYSTENAFLNVYQAISPKIPEPPPNPPTQNPPTLKTHSHSDLHSTSKKKRSKRSRRWSALEHASDNTALFDNSNHQHYFHLQRNSALLPSPSTKLPYSPSRGSSQSPLRSLPRRESRRNLHSAPETTSNNPSDPSSTSGFKDDSHRSNSIDAAFPTSNIHTSKSHLPHLVPLLFGHTSPLSLSPRATELDRFQNGVKVPMAPNEIPNVPSWESWCESRKESGLKNTQDFLRDLGVEESRIKFDEEDVGGYRSRVLDGLEGVGVPIRELVAEVLSRDVVPVDGRVLKRISSIKSGKGDGSSLKSRQSFQSEALRVSQDDVGFDGSSRVSVRSVKTRTSFQGELFGGVVHEWEEEDEKVASSRASVRFSTDSARRPPLPSTPAPPPTPPPPRPQSIMSTKSNRQRQAQLQNQTEALKHLCAMVDLYISQGFQDREFVKELIGERDAMIRELEDEFEGMNV
ncbi:hypothetical protein HDV05_000342 [Chytridiales sp. JEL 0842]|nr:hypothetical protein HDV05_000342 [Chytridiales sp. JEL 0842]